MGYAQTTKADLLVTANPGCMLQLRAGVLLFGSGQKVMHVVEVLDLAYTGSASEEFAQNGRGVKRVTPRTGELLSRPVARSRDLCASKTRS